MRFSHSFKSRGDKPAVVDVSVVSSNYFRVLGIEPRLQSHVTHPL